MLRTRTKTFTVNTTDPAGNTATQTVTYTVGYAVQALYDQTRAVKSGAVYPIKIQINDANGTDVSSSNLIVHAVHVTMASTDAPGALESAGDANPDNDFRFDSTLGTAGGYIFNDENRETGLLLAGELLIGEVVEDSNTYSFSTLTQGRSLRAWLTWSRSRVNSFSFASSF